MTPEEMKAALEKMNNRAWHRRDLDAAYEVCANAARTVCGGPPLW